MNFATLQKVSVGTAAVTGLTGFVWMCVAAAFLYTPGPIYLTNTFLDLWLSVHVIFTSLQVLTYTYIKDPLLGL